ncbi:NAD(P)H-dependent oxidoreductase [Antrihabitans cavernicola]|uniref:NAD(P)H-dependent oxidoreductase n=1 Tax=Antrihabitans cavernicola TaxID=2495913 RepID=A0A5A7SG18_9NOCA|nr:NAD(P)H-dependent oxidoreductase [Spelaeibacter cavernicola]KAA0024142.1 NAD(P)H-dependent oxidoreductase [Spelaeibacter cavernicola]
MAQSRVLVLVGSLRTASVNRQLAETAVHVAPEGADVVVFDGLGSIPFYNEDIDTPDAPIDSVVALRSAAADADALLLVTPEYNGTIPAVLKNAIDWLSRPYGQGAISGKPVAVISSSISANGAKWAQDDVRKSVGVAGGKVLEDVALTVGATGQKFGELHPRENAEVAGQIAVVVKDLVAAA